MKKTLKIDEVPMTDINDNLNAENYDALALKEVLAALHDAIQPESERI